MISRIRSIALLPILLGAPLVQPALANSSLVTRPTYTYKLIDTFEVKGRQGVASDGEFYYVSGSKALYKYDKKGKLGLANETPFEGYPIPSNHIGGIDVFNGEVFVSAENFADGVGKDIPIAIHDAKTLKLKRAFSFEPSSGQQEVSGNLRRHRQAHRLDGVVGGRGKRTLYLWIQPRHRKISAQGPSAAPAAMDPGDPFLEGKTVRDRRRRHGR